MGVMRPREGERSGREDGKKRYWERMLERREGEKKRQEGVREGWRRPEELGGTREDREGGRE